jgi:hypothetical protein
MATVARFPGKCVSCNSPILKGHGIVSIFHAGKKVWVHADCNTANFAIGSVKVKHTSGRKVEFLGEEYAIVGRYVDGMFEFIKYAHVQRVLVCGKILFMGDNGEFFSDRISQEYGDGEATIITPSYE